MKEKINRTVFELWEGELICGILMQLAVLLVENKAVYSISLWIGIHTAMAASYHMWWAIDRSLDYGEGAPKQMGVQYVYRYLGMCIMLGAVGYFFGNYVLASFAGLITIKLSAYMHPITHRMAKLVYGEEILPEKIEYLYDDEEDKKEPAQKQE